MPEDSYQQGLAIRREVLGDDYVSAALGGAAEFGRDYQRFISEYCWASCWGREGMSREKRSLVTLAIVGALGRWEELEVHVRGALRNGCTLDDIRETFFHLGVYAGVPAGVNAFKRGGRVIEEWHKSQNNEAA